MQLYRCLRDAQKRMLIRATSRTPSTISICRSGKAGRPIGSSIVESNSSRGGCVGDTVAATVGIGLGLGVGVFVGTGVGVDVTVGVGVVVGVGVSSCTGVGVAVTVDVGVGEGVAVPV